MLSSAQIVGVQAPAVVPFASRTFTNSRPQRSALRLCRALPSAGYQASAPTEPPSSVQHQTSPSRQDNGSAGDCSRRSALLASVAAAGGIWAVGCEPAAAVQGITAGRIPGISKSTDERGFHTYQRPEGKSGGHGVGWSEVPRYEFKIPDGWEEVPVNVFDLGGTEIDLRYENKDQGEVNVIVAPVLRFKEVGFNADVSLEDLGSAEKLITGFAPELIGQPLPDDSVTQTAVVKKNGRTYYQWQVEARGSRKPHHYISATAVGNRCFLLSAAGSGRQWHRAQDTLQYIQESFYVPPKVA